MAYRRYAEGIGPRRDEPWDAMLVAVLSLGLAACERDQPPAAPVAAAPQPPARPLPPPQTGVASYYGPEFAGKPTARGEPHRPDSLTAASRTLPLGTTAKVTNTKTGQFVAVEVNDRGPYAKRRILDVSPRAARRLGMKQKGVAPVKVQPLQIPSDEAR